MSSFSNRHELTRQSPHCRTMFANSVFSGREVSSLWSSQGFESLTLKVGIIITRVDIITQLFSLSLYPPRILSCLD